MKIKNEVMELIGLILGDGHISGSKRINGLFIYGDANEEADYLGRYVPALLQRNFGLKSRYWVRTSYKNGAKGAIVQLHNKKFITYLTEEIGLSRGLKTYTVTIPKHLLNYGNINYLIRGLFDADGCLYFSYSKITSKLPTYPRVELRTVSKGLANQVVMLLTKLGFNVKIRVPNKTYTVYISGEKELNRWMSIIGFSNQKHISKYLFWKKFGYYIPNTSLKKRLKIMKRAERLSSFPN